MRLLALGGGGFTHGEDAALDSYFLSLLPSAARVGYVGHANRDDALRLQRFERTYSARAALTSHLPIGSTLAFAREWLSELDAVYVAGGQTAELIEYWRRSGLDRAFAEAAAAGVLLAGVSAGAVCWFESCLSDLPGEGLSCLPGLGLFAGSCCPHFDTEPARQPAFRDRIAKGQLPTGLAIDDGVAVLLHEHGVIEAVSGRPHAQAQIVCRVDGVALSHPLPVRRLL